MGKKNILYVLALTFGVCGSNFAMDNGSVSPDRLALIKFRSALAEIERWKADRSQTSFLENALRLLEESVRDNVLAQDVQETALYDLVVAQYQLAQEYSKKSEKVEQIRFLYNASISGGRLPLPLRAIAQYNLAQMWMHGQGGPLDLKIARTLFETALATGLPPHVAAVAQFALAICCSDGDEETKDYKACQEYLEASISSKLLPSHLLVEAQNRLAIRLSLADDLVSQYARVKKLLEACATSTELDLDRKALAQVMLAGVLMIDGPGERRDLKRAQQLLKESIASGQLPEVAISRAKMALASIDKAEFKPAEHS